jgi:hypothetical protein
MRTRIADLIRDAIDIITACDDPDCEAWLNQAKAELQVMNAKAQLRQALADVEGPVQPKAKATKAPVKASKPAKPKAKPGNSKLPVPAPTLATAGL